MSHWLVSDFCKVSRWLSKWFLCARMISVLCLDGLWVISIMCLDGLWVIFIRCLNGQWASFVNVSVSAYHIIIVFPLSYWITCIFSTYQSNVKWTNQLYSVYNYKQHIFHFAQTISFFSFLTLFFNFFNDYCKKTTKLNTSIFHLFTLKISKIKKYT